MEIKKLLNFSPDTDTTCAASSCPIGLTFDLPETIPCVTLLRKTVRCLLESIGISVQDTDDLEAILGELATNAVRHAKGGNYRIAIEVCGNQVTVIVTDNGVGFTVEGVAEPGTSRPDELSEDDEFRVGGFGLLLVRSLSDDMKISRKQPNGMVIRLHKTVRHVS